MGALSAAILIELERRGTETSRKWSKAYMKDSTPFFGCSMPVVRECVRAVVDRGTTGAASKKRARGVNALGFSADSTVGDVLLKSYVDDAIELLRHDHGEAKHAGTVLLCEHEPPLLLATSETLERLEREVMRAETVFTDWAVTDGFATRVLTRVWKTNSSLAERILSYAYETDASVWHRRCGVVAFANVFKPNVDASMLPANFGIAVVNACEANVLAAPNERFAQTASAWVLRYALAADERAHLGVRERAVDVVCKHKSVWTTEAKKSLVEQLNKRADASLKARILALK